MQKHLILTCVSVLLGAGCAGSQAETVRDARMEQAEARADQNVTTVEKESSAQQDAIAGAYDAQNQAVADANAPDENATQELVEVSKDRAMYQSEAQTRLEKMGVRINEAQSKVSVLGSRAPTSLKTELKTAEQEYKLLKQDVMKLDKTPTTDWESMTSKIESRMSSLDERVEDITDAIEDV